MLVNAANMALMFTGFKASFQTGFAGAPSTYKVFSMTVSSKARQENYGWLGDLPRIREWIGDRIINNLSTHSYAIKNRKFELTIEVARDDIADDQYAVLTPFIQEMGRDSALFPDELCYGLLPTGFTTLCYDGQYFFDTDHPVTNEATGAVDSISNMQAGAGPAWYLIDASRAVKPVVFQDREPFEFKSLTDATDERVFLTDQFLYGVRARCNAGFGLWQMAYASKAALDASAYSSARTSMMTLKGPTGKRLGINPTHMIVPPSLEVDALTLLKAVNNEAGASNIWANSVELIVSPWLD